MANSSFHLYQLQKIDLQIDQNNMQVKKINELLLGNPVLQAAEEKLRVCKEELHKKNSELKQIEENAHAKQIKIEQSEASLYKGSISNPKELKDLQAEIVSLKKSLSQIEENQLELMDSVEKLEAAQNQANNEFQTVLSRVAAENGKLNQDLEHLKRSLDNLAVERVAALKQIAPDIATIYEKLRLSKRRIAVSQVEDEACATCGAEISPSDVQKARGASGLVFCPSCGRILYGG